MADIFFDMEAGEEVDQFVVTDSGLQGSTIEEELEALIDDDELAKLFSDDETPLDVEETLHDTMQDSNLPASGKSASPGAASAAKADAPTDVPPPPPPFGSEVADEVQRQADYRTKGDKMSKFMQDPAGNLLHKWKADYATRSGGGRAQCRDTDCLERHDQGGVRWIEKGCLRIGRRINMPGKGDGDAQLSMMWFHARCIFNSFSRARKATRIIESPGDVDEFEKLSLEDQDLLRRIIDGTEDCRKAKFAAVTTPSKRAAAEFDLTPAKRRFRIELPQLKAGDRVWIHSKVKGKLADGPSPAGAAAFGAFITQSKKCELAKVVEEPKDGRIIVQFEKAEDEKERVAKYAQKKFKQIRGWLRYPRVFEGQKQRLPVDWIDTKRDAPRLCGCTTQKWGHQCDGTGISCGRSGSSKVWGLDFA